MRPRTAPAAPATAAVLVLLLGPAAPSASADVAVAGREPRCGDGAAAPGFPLRTRIRGAPAEYRAGGGFQGWDVELTNTTSQPCRNIHPVLVLTDRSGALRPGEVRLEFADPSTPGGRRPVLLEETDAREVVGVLDGGPAAAGGGFTVPAGGTVRVPVRLAFTAGAHPDEITVHAAIVQRRGDDGDWVGESGAYRLTLLAPGPTAAPPSGTPYASGSPAEPSGAATAASARPPDPGELARSGQPSPAGPWLLAGAAAGCVALGAAAVLVAARLRRHRR
ncbi:MULTISPECIES: hypothetical protein [unclassified Streptomyces]|uniref:hypothetical protein n=1 Tax=unclassified Streptomyces TaxID=2593676 RepID=UPI0009A0C408|nr:MULTISPECIES: hypothetical protein [unclassified Streptomyces]